MDENNNTQFGMTEEELKAANRNELILKIKTIFASIAPFIINFFKTVIYYLIRFIKAFISASFRMIMGKE